MRARFPVSLVAYPRADDGAMLAGAGPACTFTSSSPDVASVEARGVVAILTPLATARRCSRRSAEAFPRSCAHPSTADRRRRC